jgi:integrase
MRKRLNDTVVARIPLPTTGRVDVWDTLLPAFGCRVSSTGSRTWVVALRRGGTSSRKTVGKFPAMSTADAREQARLELAGDDGVATPRFKDLADRFLSHGYTSHGRPMRPGTLRVYKFVLEQVAEQLHDLPVADIGRGAIAALVHEAAKTRGAATAALTRSTLSRFCAWLIEVGEIEISPATRSPKYSAERGRRVLTNGEIRAIWHGGTGRFGAILRLLLLLGARRTEIGDMRWSEIDGDVWTVPEDRTKSHRELVLPLPAAALAEINAQPRILGQDHVFGRNGARGFTGWGDHKARLDRRLGLPKKWRIHDLRRTVRTRLHSLGVPYEVVSHVFNHDLGAIASTYDHHHYLPEMRAALDKWAVQLEQIVLEPAAGVVTLGQ